MCTIRSLLGRQLWCKCAAIAVRAGLVPLALCVGRALCAGLVALCAGLLTPHPVRADVLNPPPSSSPGIACGEAAVAPVVNRQEYEAANAEQLAAHNCSVCRVCGRFRCRNCGIWCECPPAAAGGGSRSRSWPPHYVPCPPERVPLRPGEPTPAMPPTPAEAPSPGLVPSPELRPGEEAPLPGAPTAPQDFAAAAPTLGALAGVAGVPNMIGDSFGGITQFVIVDRVSFSVMADGFVVSGVPPGDPNGTIAFEVGPDPPQLANDFYSVGTGSDTAPPSGQADTFAISEPVPPTDAPTAGPGYIFEGGTAFNPRGTYDDGDTWDVNYSYSQSRIVVIPLPSSGGAVIGRVKIAENNSPIPRDRIFVNYSFFDNVPLTASGIAVHRYIPGLEHAFYDGLMSVEVRFPFAGTLDPEIVLDSTGGIRSDEFGNIFTTYKAVLWHTDSFVLSAGLAVTAPTARDLRVRLPGGRELVRIENESVHLMPLVGWFRQRGDRAFTHGFLQIDADANGSSVLVDQQGTGLVEVGKLHDTTFMYVDYGLGWWLFRNRGRRENASFAPTIELHYNRSLESTEPIESAGFRIGQVKERIQELNLVLGGTLVWDPHLALTVGYAVPVGNGSDQAFDGELRLLCNWLP